MRSLLLLFAIAFFGTHRGFGQEPICTRLPNGKWYCKCVKQMLDATSGSVRSGGISVLRYRKIKEVDITAYNSSDTSHIFIIYSIKFKNKGDSTFINTNAQSILKLSFPKDTIMCKYEIWGSRY